MKSLIRSAAGIVIFIIIWQVVSVLLSSSNILPGPVDIFNMFFKLLLSKTIINAALQTAWKVFFALILVLLIGIPLGLILGLVNTLYEMFRPIIMIIQAVPVISWLSLVIFAWGIGWRGPVFIAFLSLLPIAILTTVSGVRNRDQQLIEMASLYRVPFKKILIDIYLGSLIPFIIAIIDVSIGQAWKVILVTEYLCGNSGLGVQIFTARYGADINGVYALTLLAVILGIITERLIKTALGRIKHRWQPV